MTWRGRCTGAARRSWGGYKELFATLDVNVTHSQLGGLSEFLAKLYSVRFGWNTKLGENPFRLQHYFQYQVILKPSPDDVQDLYLYRRLGGDELASIGRSAEDELFDQITDGDILDALEALPEQYRTAVMLADVEGFAYKEIAEILDIPIGTVMSRLHRGRKKLQEQLYSFGVDRGYVDEPDELPEPVAT